MAKKVKIASETESVTSDVTSNTFMIINYYLSNIVRFLIQKK